MSNENNGNEVGSQDNDPPEGTTNSNKNLTSSSAKGDSDTMHMYCFIKNS